jgi:hypothetical protein
VVNNLHKSSTGTLELITYLKVTFCLLSDSGISLIETSLKSLTGKFNPVSSINYVFHPASCKPNEREWIQRYPDSTLKDYANIISNIVVLVNNLNQDSFKNSLNNFEKSYIKYLNSCIEMLDLLNSSIFSIIGEIKGKAGNETIFSILNIKFRGTIF